MLKYLIQVRETFRWYPLSLTQNWSHFQKFPSILLPTSVCKLRFFCHEFRSSLPPVYEVSIHTHGLLSIAMRPEILWLFQEPRSPITLFHDLGDVTLFVHVWLLFIGTLKGACVRIKTLHIYKNEIHEKIIEIYRHLFERVERNFRGCLQFCVDEKGHHLNDVMFRTWTK